VTAGFGIDLGAYGRRRGTAVVAAQRSEKAASLYVLEGTAFDNVFAGPERINEQLCSERELLISLLNQGQVAVDVPLDLQKLPCLEMPTYNWELTLRPVDRAFQAMPPLASFLGHCVARFQCHFRALRDDALLETYPAACHELCGSVVREAFSELDSRFSSDEKDAALCALVAVARHDEVLGGDELDSVIRRKLGEFGEGAYGAPENYRLLRRVPQKIKFERMSFDNWLSTFNRG
jgi:predicted nuclease with RNAse H fold